MDSKSAQNELGDPSGQDSATYWDEWFKKVSAGQTFEWYASPDQIAHILELTNTVRLNGLRALHAGSGNSMLPVDLIRKHGAGRQTIMDCSEVALDEMRQLIDETEQSSSSSIELVLGDILQSPLPFESAAYDAWIDKGLADAIFSECGPIEMEQCGSMLSEASRLLHDGGVCVIVSLAQNHSLELILSTLQWFHGHRYISTENRASNWCPPLHIYEVKPESDASALRPFAFVIRKEGGETSKEAKAKDSSNEGAVLFHRDNGDVAALNMEDATLENVVAMLDQARTEFAAQVQERQKANAPGISMSQVTIQVKPYDDETDMEILGEKLQEKCSKSKIFTSLTWIDQALKPMGFGLFYLELKLIICSEQIEELCEFIAEEEEDAVQSVDVDWNNTFQCMDIMSIVTQLPR